MNIPQRILRNVADEFGVKVKEILSRSRTTWVVKARGEVARQLRAVGMSLTDVGRTLNRNHSTVARVTTLDPGYLVRNRNKNRIRHRRKQGLCETCPPPRPSRAVAFGRCIECVAAGLTEPQPWRPEHKLAVLDGAPQCKRCGCRGEHRCIDMTDYLRRTP